MARDVEQIKQQLALAEEGVAGGSKWPALSYEEGVVAALAWLMGMVDEAPMDEGGHG